MVKNNLLVDNFQKEKQRWEKVINQKPNFFSDTELMLIYQDTLLLRVSSDSHATFLAKTYQLEYQSICQKTFSEKKNIILISERQWKEEKGEENLIVLLKDEANINNSLDSWLKYLSA